jgi:large subunit ribosomal protein L18
VFRSLNHVYAQIIDDDAGRTLVSASSLKLQTPAPTAQDGDGEGEKGKPRSVKVQRSMAVGRVIAEAALAKGIEQVTFDRGGYLYHGRVAALAKEARKKGLKF